MIHAGVFGFGLIFLYCNTIYLGRLSALHTPFIQKLTQNLQMTFEDVLANARTMDIHNSKIAVFWSVNCKKE